MKSLNYNWRKNLIMENEQGAKPSTQEPAATPKAAEEAKPAEDKQQDKPAEPFKTFATQEDYDKAIKSEASKQKLEWMREVGVQSVDEFKTTKSKYDEATKNYDQVVKERNDLSDKLLVRELDVGDEYANDLLTLAKSKVSPDKDLKAAASEILDKNPGWKVSRAQSIKIGTEKASPAPVQTDDKLSARYPWLR